LCDSDAKFLSSTKQSILYSLRKVKRVKGVQKESVHTAITWSILLSLKIFATEPLNEQQPIERQYYAVTALVSCFFSYYTFAHIWDEKVVRQAIIVGVKNRTFAYVANAHKDNQENLVLGGPASTTVYYGKDIRAHELDMGESAFILSAAYAQQLLTPPTPARVEPAVETPTITNDVQPGQQAPQVYSGESGGTVVHDSPSQTTLVPSAAKPVAPGRGGQHYRLSMKIKPVDFYEVTKAMERLNDQAATMDTTVTVIATAKAGQPFNANTMHNLVVEPMVEESNVVVLEEHVEE
jgi:hypothetical protein